MKKLIITADDYGMSEGVNEAIDANIFLVFELYSFLIKRHISHYIG